MYTLKDRLIDGMVNFKPVY